MAEVANASTVNISVKSVEKDVCGLQYCTWFNFFSHALAELVNIAHNYGKCRFSLWS
jgi:hypothetical protein